MRDGWTPTQVSSHTPWWGVYGWGGQLSDTYNPRHFLTPGSVRQLRHPQNYVIPRYTYIPEPNPYTDARWVRSYEEIGRMGQDIDWPSLGTRGS